MLYQGREIRVLVVFPAIERITVQPARDIRLESISLPALVYGLDEVNEIVRLLKADTLTGKRATLLNLVDELRNGCDIVWIISHADENGWYLTNEIVDTADTTALLRSCGAFLTVMNTCSSIELAKKAAAEIGSAFICTVKEVPDQKAFLMGTLFAQNLAAGYSYREAYDLAKPGQNQTYVLIEAEEMPPPRDSNSYVDKSNLVDPETIMRFVKSVEEMDIILNGSPKLGIPGVRTSLLNLEGDVKKALLDIADIKTQQRILRWQVVASSIGLLVVLITQGILLFLTVGR